MAHSVLICFMLAGCPAADPEVEPDGSGEATWNGAIGDHPLQGTPAAIFVYSNSGSLQWLTPAMSAGTEAIVGVELDPSITVFVTDIPNPCSTLTEYMEIASSAVGVTLDLELLGTLPELPAQYGYIAVSVGAESEAALAHTYDVEDSEEGPNGFHAGNVDLNAQRRTIDWDALQQGASVDSYMARPLVQSGTVTIDDVRLGEGLLGGEATVVPAGGEELGVPGEAIDLSFTATHCPTLEAVWTGLLNSEN